jgi:anti-sigma factor RsiW
MNTKPNDEILARWVEDELDGSQAAEVEAWAADQSEWLERREQARWSRELLGRNLGGPEDVPHAEFFNARIRREIERDEAQRPAPAVLRSRRPWLWALPATAAACLALGFFLGEWKEESTADRGLAAEWAPVLYTPEQGVEAEFVGGEDATVIVLAGVEAISDDWEIPETAMLPPESSRMARRDQESDESVQ